VKRTRNKDKAFLCDPNGVHDTFERPLWLSSQWQAFRSCYRVLCHRGRVRAFSISVFVRGERTFVRNHFRLSENIGNCRLVSITNL